MFSMIERFRSTKVAVTALLLVFFLINLLSVRNLTLTYDEPRHYAYGLQILSLDSNRLIWEKGKIDDSKMPFSVLNAIPGMIAQLLPQGSAKTILADITTGRLATILFSLILAWLVYRWCEKLYGFVPALFSVFLYILEPNIIAHSQLITTDIYATGMIAISVYALWNYSETQSLKHAVILALVLGLSQLSKYTALFLYPVCAVLLLVKDLPFLRGLVMARNLRALWAYIRRQVLLVGLIVLVSLIIINAGYLFNRSFTRFGDYTFQFHTFKALQIRLPFLNKVPVPLPYPYVQGIDLVNYYEQTGRGRGLNYLFGQLSQQGFPGYFFIAWLYKVPLAIQIAFFVSIVLFIAWRKERRFLKNEWFLIGPILFFSIYFNFFYRAQIGIRYFLVVFPFILIFCGNLLSGWRSFRRSHWVATGLLAAYLVISVFSYFPHFLPYFNELVPNRSLSYRVLADSNLDWGQAEWYLGKYLEAHPEAIYDPETPVTGTIVVPVNDLVGITIKPKIYQWLRNHYKPVGTVAYAYLIYIVPAKK
jgi:4-amino-4-deoxy-L-arabinose transferase-like glycosyltransferase